MIDPTIFEIANELKPSYKYIDFRAAFYRENEQRKHIISIFRFTNKSKKDIDRIHEKLRKDSISIGIFEIELEIISLDNWKSKWDELKGNLLDIQKNFNLNQVKLEKNTRNRRSTSWISEIDLEYDSIQFNILIDSAPAHHNKFQFLSGHRELRSRGFESIYPNISKILQIKAYNFNHPLYCTFIFPIYANINSLNFTNQYLAGELEFHELYQDSDIFIDFILRGQSKGRIGEYSIKSHKDKFQKTDGILNMSLPIRMYLDREDFDKNENESQIYIKLYFKPLNLNVLEYEIFYTSLKREIKNKDLIPEDLFHVINPLLKFNLIERKNFNAQSEEYIKNLSTDRIKEIFNSIKKNLDWLKENNTYTVLNDFFISAANENNEGYFNTFKELLIFTCETVIQKKIIEKEDLLSEINDLIIRYSIGPGRYNYKLFSYNESLTKIRDEINNLYDKYFRKKPKCNYYPESTFLSRYNFEYPRLLYDCEYSITDEMNWKFFFIHNDTRFFNYNTIYIVFLLYSKPREENIWSQIEKNFINTLRSFIKDVINLPSITSIESINIPYQLQSDFPLEIYTEKKISQQDKEWIKTNRLSLSKWKFQDETYNFKRLNIFVGKNNSGKTYVLESIYNKNGSFAINDPLIQKRFQELYGSDEPISFYYIPKYRILEESKGRRENLISALLNLFSFDKTLKNNQPNFFTNVDDEGNQIGERFHLNVWKLPHFLEIVDLSSYIYENDNRLMDKDRKLINHNRGKLLIENLRKIYQNWVRIIEDFFPEIKISNVKDSGIAGDISIEINDTILNFGVDDWNIYGSGTKELISLIFFIEFLKCIPAVDYDQLRFIFDRSLSFDKDFERDLSKFILPIRNNRILLIDEPEISLHPSLQRKFFQYLRDSSQLIQIFIATQSSQFLEINRLEERLNDDIAVFLCKKVPNGANKFKKIIITSQNLIKVIDEIFDYNPIDTGFLLSKKKYEYIMNADFNLMELNMIENLVQKRFEYDNNYKKLMQLGTLSEENDARLVQNVHLLISESNFINLNIRALETKKLKQLIIYQMNKNKKLINDDKKSRYWQFIEEIWNIELAEEYNILKYTPTQINKIRQKVKNELSKMEEMGIKEYESLLVFPENSIPYDIIDDLIEFAKKNKIVIIGGMEHSKITDIEIKLEKIMKKYQNYKNPYKYESIIADQEMTKDTYINQAIIINADQNFCFQIKNVPFFHLKSNNKEGIPIIYNPFFRKIGTVIGNLSIFICKDFLVNYEVIDKWMEKNNIKIIVVPSFTGLVNPFRNRFGILIHSKENIDKSFIFINVAEYGGSGTYSYINEKEYEPGEDGPLKSYDERWIPIDFKI